MASHNGSDDDSLAYKKALESVMFESNEAARLAKAARDGTDDEHAIAAAEKALEDGFETESESRRRKGVEKALELDPGCTDALTLRAQTFEEPTDAVSVLEAAVEVAERRLGSKLFEEQRGSFWDIHETRPFMRALFALAEAEIDSVDLQAGVDHFQRLLDLSDLDKLGVRHVLLGILLAADRVEHARQVAFERFEADDSPFMLWARALILYVERDFDGAAAALARAKEENPYVEDLLMNDASMPEEEPAMYAPGSPEEAAIVVSGLAAAWRCRPLALVWMKVGGRPGDDRYFGIYTNVELEGLLDGLDDDDFDDELDDDFGGGPILVN